MTGRLVPCDHSLMFRKFLLLPLLATMALAEAPPAAVTDLLTVIQPAADEASWLAIPWETNLTEARRKADAAGRPIFLWEMDGHPLGCT